MSLKIKILRAISQLELRQSEILGRSIRGISPVFPLTLTMFALGQCHVDLFRTEIVRNITNKLAFFVKHNDASGGGRAKSRSSRRYSIFIIFFSHRSSVSVIYHLMVFEYSYLCHNCHHLTTSWLPCICIRVIDSVENTMLMLTKRSKLKMFCHEKSFRSPVGCG